MAFVEKLERLPPVFRISQFLYHSLIVVDACSVVFPSEVTNGAVGRSHCCPLGQGGELPPPVPGRIREVEGRRR